LRLFYSEGKAGGKELNDSFDQKKKKKSPGQLAASKKTRITLRQGGEEKSLQPLSKREGEGRGGNRSSLTPTGRGVVVTKRKRKKDPGANLGEEKKEKGERT